MTSLSLNFKKIFAVTLVSFMLSSNLIYADSIKGHIQKGGQKEELNKNLYTGEIDKLDRKDVVNLTVSQTLSSGYSIEGDEFFAEVSQDVEGDKGIILPVGTIFHGTIQKIADPKNNGRNGYVNVNFDYFVTPDGKEVPIKASFTTKDSKIKGAMKTVAHHTGYTLLGGVAGGFIALNTLGLGAAIASNGYTLAGGAAVGGLVGLTMAIIKKGKGFLINPGDEMRIVIESDIDMPVYSPDAFRQEELLLDGLNVRINAVKLEKDPFGIENTITLSLGIDNYTEYTFSSFDIALMSNTNETFFPSPFGDTSLWFKSIEPGERAIGKLSFSVSDKKARHWLVFFDRRTKKPVAKYSIDNAKSDIKALAKAKQKKSKKTKKS